MKSFIALYEALDATTSTNAKKAAMVKYFAQARPEDAAWAVYFLTGQRLKRLVNTRELREWTSEYSGLPDWLVEESYEHVGDLAETMALLTPEPGPSELQLPALSVMVEQVLRPMADLDDEQRQAIVVRQWQSLPGNARFVFNKLITGALRVGVSKRLVTRALSELAGLDSGMIAHRMMGNWQPTAEQFQKLISKEHDQDLEDSTPYPFFLASPLEIEPNALGLARDWSAEWKWDGIRAQLIRRNGRLYIWSRGEDLLEGRFPEIEQAARDLPDGIVLDGEIMAWRDGQPLPFARLQTRIGRKKPGAKTLQQAPVAFLAFDLLEYDGQDIRQRPLADRYSLMKTVLPTQCGQLLLPGRIEFSQWDALARLRESSRERGVEGLMLKRLNSTYQHGRKRGDWWKWKVDPFTFDGVLIYAQPGHGRRSGLFTDYTFAVHSDQGLVPVAKAYSGLTQAEIDELDRWIRAHTRERFGPVRSVDAVHVFELAFEGIARSKRHKSGVALRFPRIHRWRRDLKVDQADQLKDLEQLIAD